MLDYHAIGYGGTPDKWKEDLLSHDSLVDPLVIKGGEPTQTPAPIGILQQSSSGSPVVEPGGIEPPSESASAGTSPGAESPFYSLARAWTLTLAGPVASLCMVRSKLCALTFAADRRLASGPRPSRRRRSLLRQREEQSYCCSLIYNCPFYGCQAHPPAIPVSAPPSKPVRPLVVVVAKSA